MTRVLKNCVDKIDKNENDSRIKKTKQRYQGSMMAK